MRPTAEEIARLGLIKDHDGRFYRLLGGGAGAGAAREYYTPSSKTTTIMAPSAPLRTALTEPVKSSVSASRSAADLTSLPDPECFELFHSLFEAMASHAHISTQTAVSLSEKKLSYSELNKQSNQLAHHLMSKGIKHEEIVVIAMPCSFEAIIALLGILKSGAAFSILSLPVQQGEETQGLERFRYCLSLLRPRYLLSSSATVKQWVGDAFSDLNLIDVNAVDFKESISRLPTTNPKIALKPNSLAYITFTSGSTGNPKGVLIEHKGLNSRLIAHQALMFIKPGDSVAQFCRLEIDAAFMELMLALGTGAQLVLIPECLQSDYSRLAQYYESQNVSIAIFTPTVWQKLHPKNFKRLRAMLTTGEGFNAKALLPWLSEGRVGEKERLLINGYGPSEVTIATSLRVYDPASDQVSIGHALAGLEMHILNPDTKKAVAPYEEGEIYIRGLGVGRHYYSPPWMEEEDKKRIDKLNKERFIDTLEVFSELAGVWYKTGDRGFYNEKKDFFVTGRYDLQFKIGARIVAPENIEAKLEQCAGLKKGSAYVCLRTCETKKHIVAGLKLHRLPSADELYALATRVAQHLDSQLLPQRWYISLEDRTHEEGNWKAILGKEVQKALSTPESFHLIRKTPEAVGIVLTPTQKHILELWKKVLLTNVEQGLAEFDFGLDDSFRLLGGDSIAYMDLRHEFAQLYPTLSFPVELFKKNPTVRYLARYVEQSQDLKISADEHLQKSTSLNPGVFLIHPVTGLNDGYVELGAAFADRNVYGLKARGLEDPHLMGVSIEEIAADLVRKIVFTQPSGPYVIMGHSAGGVIAYEIAYQLQRQGHRAIAYMLDSLSPAFIRELSPTHSATLVKRLISLLASFLSLPEPEITIDLTQWNSHLVCLEEAFATFQKSATTTASRHALLTAQIITTAIWHYHPPTTVNDVYLWVAQSSDWYAAGSQYGWSISIENVKEFPCDHFLITHGDSVIALRSHVLNLALPQLPESILVKSALTHLTQKAEQSLTTAVEAKALAMGLERKISLLGRKYAEFSLEGLDFNDELKRIYSERFSQIDAMWNEEPSSMDAFYVELSLVQEYKTSSGIEVVSESITIEEILKRIMGGERLRVLGAAGSGKSTLLRSIAYRWAKGLLLKDLPMLIILPLREIKMLTLSGATPSEQLADWVGQYIWNKKFTMAERHFLASRLEHEEAFILLDGYDEVSSGLSKTQESLILSLLTKKNALISSRPLYLYRLNAEEKHIAIKGFNDEQITLFITKQLSVARKEVSDLSSLLVEANKFIEILKEHTQIWELARYPLNLKLICLVHQGGKLNFDQVTLTELYMQIEELIEVRHRQRLAIGGVSSLEEDFLLEEERGADWSPLSQALEELAYYAMENDILLIPKEILQEISKKLKEKYDGKREIVKELLECGLIQGVGINRREIDRPVEFLHLSLQEYFYAKAIIRRFDEMKIDNFKEWFSAWLTKIRFVERYEITLNFLSGFFDKKLSYQVAGELLKSLSLNLDEYYRNSKRLKRTLLLTSAGKGLYELTQLLLAAGVNIEQKDEYWNTALLLAIDQGYENIVRALLKYKASLEVRQLDTNYSPLHLAATKSRPSLVELLVKSGAQLDEQTRKGYTALMLAFLENHEPTIMVLLELAPAVYKNTDWALLPMVVAFEMGYEKIGSVLFEGNIKNLMNLYTIYQLLSLAYQAQSKSLEELIIKYHVEKLSSAVANTDSLLTFDSTLYENLTNIAFVQSRIKLEKGYTIFLQACKKGQVTLVKYLLERGCFITDKVTEGDFKGCTALHLASACGQVEVIKILLKHGSLLSETGLMGLTPLLIACDAGQTDVVEMLLDEGASLTTRANGYTALLIASFSGRHLIVRLLLERGADLYERSHDGRTALIIAVENDHQEVLETLLMYGAVLSEKRVFPDGTSWSIPLVAARYKAIKSLKFLVEQAINFKDYVTEQGYTMLMAAARSGSYETFELVLLEDGDVGKKTNEGDTVLMAAARGGNTKILESLLNMGLSVNAKKDDGYTALLFSVREGHLEATRFLLIKGADYNNIIEIGIDAGKTAMMLAKENNHTQIIRLLEIFITSGCIPEQEDTVRQAIVEVDNFKFLAEPLKERELALHYREHQLRSIEIKLKLFRKNILAAIREQLEEPGLDYDDQVKILAKFKHTLQMLAKDVKNDIDAFMSGEEVNSLKIDEPTLEYLVNIVALRAKNLEAERAFILDELKDSIPAANLKFKQLKYYADTLDAKSKKLDIKIEELRERYILIQIFINDILLVIQENLLIREVDADKRELTMRKYRNILAPSDLSSDVDLETFPASESLVLSADLLGVAGLGKDAIDVIKVYDVIIDNITDAKIALRQGYIADAIRFYSTVLELKSNIDFVYAGLACCYVLRAFSNVDQLDSFAKAEEYFIKAYSIKPSLLNSVAYVNFLCLQKRFSETLPYLNPRLENETDNNQGKVKFWLSTKTLAPEAIQYELIAAEEITCPAVELMFFYHVKAYSEMGDLIKAKYACAKLAKLAEVTEDALAFCLLGYAYVILKDDAMARDIFAIAASLRDGYRLAEKKKQECEQRLAAEALTVAGGPALLAPPLLPVIANGLVGAADADSIAIDAEVGASLEVTIPTT